MTVATLVKSKGEQTKPTMAVSAEVCPRRRGTEECVTARGTGQGEETRAALRHDVERAPRRPNPTLRRPSSHAPYIGI